MPFIPFFYTLYRFVLAGFSALKDEDFKPIFSLLIIMLASGTIFYHEIEGWRWIDSFYFSVTTLTTIGFGDFTPHTDIGKLFTVVYIFMGLGVIFGFIEIMTEHAGKHQSSLHRVNFAGVSKFIKKRRRANPTEEE